MARKCNWSYQSKHWEVPILGKTDARPDKQHESEPYYVKAKIPKWEFEHLFEKVFENRKKCEVCGCTEYFRLGLHHINPFKKKRKNASDNIMLVCFECHKTIHEKK